MREVVLILVVAVLLGPTSRAEAARVSPATQAFALQRANQHWAGEGRQLCQPVRVKQVKTDDWFKQDPNMLAHVARVGGARKPSECEIVVNYRKNWADEGRRLFVTRRA